MSKHKKEDGYIKPPETWQNRLKRMNPTVQEGKWPKRWIEEAKDYELLELRAALLFMERDLVKSKERADAEQQSYDGQSRVIKALKAKLAAEPDLLVALEEAISMLGSRLIKDTFGYDWHEKATAAIAKARGEE